MTNEQMLELAQRILDGPDKEAAASLVEATAAATYRLLGEALARNMLGGDEAKTTTIAVSPELLAMLAPRPAEITVDLIQQEQPKRKSRTVVTRHDAKGRIVEFVQEPVE
jgi:hypothetical protein